MNNQFIDPFKSDGNYTLAIAGKAGLGKNLYIKEFATSILKEKGNLFFIGDYYKDFVKLHNGQIIDLKNICLDPFKLFANIYNDSDDEFYKDDVFRLIESLIRIMLDCEASHQSIILSEAIKNTLVDDQRSFRGLHNQLSKVTGNSYQKNLALELKNKLVQFIKKYDYYLKKPLPNLNNITLFALDSFGSNESEFKLITTALSLALIQAKIKHSNLRRNIKKALIIGNAIEYINYQDSSFVSLVQNFIRTTRIFGTSTIVTATNKEEYSHENTALKAIFDYADNKIFLREATNNKSSSQFWYQIQDKELQDRQLMQGGQHG